MFLSVILCTYRRPDRVRFALESLTRQTYQGVDWEVLVVENDEAPSGDIKSVVDEFQDRLRIRYCFESMSNLSRARNLGAQEAAGTYIVYLDDDAEANEGWVETIVQGCKTFAPDFAGGPYYPLYRTKKPYWFKDEYGSGGFWGTSTVRLSNVQGINGGNYIVRRELVAALDGFNEKLGMAGNTVSYGEDVELLSRARSKYEDLKVYYFPDAFILHEVRPEKMTLTWRIHSDIKNAKSFGVHRKKPFTLPFKAKRIAKSIWQIVLALPMLVAVLIVDVTRPHKALWKRYFVDKINPHIYTIVFVLARTHPSAGSG